MDTEGKEGGLGYGWILKVRKVAEDKDGH